MNSAAESHLLSQQSFKTLPTSLINTFRRISLPGDAGSQSVLTTAAGNSSQSVVTTAGYFVHSPVYLSPTGIVETAALRDLEAFASEAGNEHVFAQSPDTTDSVGSQGYVESSSIGQSTSTVVADDISHGLKESPSSPSVCTTCGRGCGCQKQFEDSVDRRMSQDSTSSFISGSLKLESTSVDCESMPQSLSLSASFPQQQQQQQQSQQSTVMLNEDVFSSPLELTSTLHELSIAARQPPTGSTADLIEHTIQAIVDAHVNTCLYTSDKVATGLREYELMLSTKAPVS